MLPLNLAKCKGASGVLQIGVKYSDKHVHRIVNSIELLTVN